MSNMTTSKTCFISAPAGANLDVLKTAIERRGLRVLIPNELTVGADWASEIRNQLSRADLVIGVLTLDHHSPWVLFELGQASALGRRIVLIISPKAEPIPFSLHQFLVLRTELNNADAIDFALDQVLSAPEPLKQQKPRRTKALTGLGARSAALLESLEHALAQKDWRSLEDVVADALRSSGTDIVVTSPIHDEGVDLAVWSDVLEPFVGNPLLIEVKGKVEGKTAFTRAITQLASFVDASGSRWGLLLYGDGPEFENQPDASTFPNVLVLSLRYLFENLRTRAFPELVRDLRNQRVHGTSK